MDFLQLDIYSIWLSLKVALLTVIIAMPFAVIAGYGLARKQFFGKVFLEAVVLMPMVMPPVTTGYLLLLVFGTNGLVGRWVYELLGIRIAFTFWATVLAAVVVSFPLMVRSVKTAMQMVDPGLEQASVSLGASPIRTFMQITLPLARPGILSGMVLAFARSLGEFGATITFAGNIEGVTRTLPLAIYSEMQIPGREMETYVLVGISVIISFAAIIGSHFFQEKYNHSK